MRAASGGDSAGWGGRPAEVPTPSPTPPRLVWLWLFSSLVSRTAGRVLYRSAGVWPHQC